MRLPFLPLHAVLFPHLPMPLNLFEPRYRAMARDLLRPGSPWDGRLVVSMITEGQEVGDDPQAQAMGTIAEVRSGDQLADGRFAVLAVGVSRAVLTGVDRGGAYAVVEAIALDDPEGEGGAALVDRVQEALDEYMTSVKRFVTAAASVGREAPEIRTVTASIDEVLKPIRLPREPVAASYAVSGVLQVELVRKQELLELPTAAARLSRALDLLHRESRLLGQGAMPSVSPGDLQFPRN